MGKEWVGLFFPRGKNGPAHSFRGEKTDWGEIPACYTGNLTYSQALGAKQLPPIPADDTPKKSTGDPNPISSRKFQTKSAKSHSHNAAKSETSPKHSSLQTLIIGDSILSGINQRGLRNKVECQPISGASVDLLLEKVQIYDLKKFQNIIIYVSGNDASQNIDIEYIEEKYEQLVCLIKNKNSTINIYLCSIRLASVH